MIELPLAFWVEQSVHVTVVHNRRKEHNMAHTVVASGVACISVMWDSALSRLEQGNDRRVEIGLGFVIASSNPSISSFLAVLAALRGGIAFSS